MTYKYKAVIRGLSEGLVEVRAGAIFESLDQEGKVSSYAGKTESLYVAVNDKGKIEKVSKEMPENWPSYTSKGEVVKLEEIERIGVLKGEIKKQPYGLFETMRKNPFTAFPFLVALSLLAGIIILTALFCFWKIVKNG